MFMANDILFPRRNELMRNHDPETQETIEQEAIEDCVKKYFCDKEKTSWDEFYRGMSQIRWIVGRNVGDPVVDKKAPKPQPEDRFVHGAVHDAESVYCLCLLFFNRMQRSGVEYGPETAKQRGEAFETLSRKQVDNQGTRAFMGYFLRDGFDSQFFDMLNTINRYLSVPWYNVNSTQRGERHEFHLHDFMQRLILKELHKMRQDKKPILLEKNPLRVKVKDPIWISAYTYNLIASSGDLNVSGLITKAV